MNAQRWSQEEIEEYSKNICMLYSKANEMRNQALKEYAIKLFSSFKTQAGMFLYRLTHLGHKPQLR